MKRAILGSAVLIMVLSACSSGVAAERVRLKWRFDLGPGIYEMPGVMSDSGLTWSPDGQTIAALWDRMPYPDFCWGCEVGTALYVIDAATLVKTPLIKKQDRHISSISWLPDSKHLAYRDYYSGELHSIGIDGVEDGRLLDLDGYPAWSPDGSKIAARGSEGGPGHWYPVINIFDAQGHKLDTPFTGDIQFGYLSVPSWSPDGTRLLFSYRAGFASEPAKSETWPSVFMLDLRTGQAKPVTEQGREYWDAAFSPVGDLMALSQWEPRRQLVLQDLSSGCSRALPIDDPGKVSWGPDGRRLVVSSGVTTYLISLGELLGSKFAETGSICP